MYLKRKVDIYLEEWKKNKDRLPFIVKGARQVGKNKSIWIMKKIFENMLQDWNKQKL